MVDKSSRGCLNKPHDNWPQTRRGYNLEAVLANLVTIKQFGGHVVPIWRQCGANLVPIRQFGGHVVPIWHQFGTNWIPC